MHAHILFFASHLPLSLHPHHTTIPHTHAKPHPPRQHIRTQRASAILSDTQQKALLLVSLPSFPILAYSEYTLFTTGCGLPPGPYGILGAMEGVSYLVLAGVLGLSVFSKVTTGSGLPDGPGKLVGGVEGFAYVLLVCGLAAAGATYVKFGELPNAVPSAGSRCFPADV